MTYLRMGVVGTATRKMSKEHRFIQSTWIQYPRFSDRIDFRNRLWRAFWCFRQCFGKQSKRIVFSEKSLNLCDVVLLPKQPAKISLL